ncbi:electron transport complex subunit RsxB [Pseudomonas sp. S 311-6]|nr:electron transport complex subunit RsxB [Pseudomonas sp. S 311-6]
MSDPLSGPRLALRIDALLPQTQCTQCGYDGCRPYADAIAAGDAEINRCPPGGTAGVDALASLLDRPALPLDPSCGEFNGFHLAVIEEKHCIGCTLCITACPVDAIVGANKRMHTVLEDWCTGCELCLPACPVDCIAMVPAGRDWQRGDADIARQRHQASQSRRQRLRQASQQAPALPPIPLAATATANAPSSTPAPVGGASADTRKRAVIADVLARARARRAAPAAPGGDTP